MKYALLFIGLLFSTFSKGQTLWAEWSTDSKFPMPSTNIANLLNLAKAKSTNVWAELIKRGYKPKHNKYSDDISYVYEDSLTYISIKKDTFSITITYLHQDKKSPPRNIGEEFKNSLKGKGELKEDGSFSWMGYDEQRFAWMGNYVPLWNFKSQSIGLNAINWRPRK